MQDNPGKIIFISGYPRAGTTLLQSILCSQGNTNPVIGEAIFHKDIVLLLANSLRVYDTQTKHFFDDRYEMLDMVQGFAATFVTHMKNRFGVDNLVLKDPLLIKALGATINIHPTAKFVMIIRDPRDIISSLMRVNDKLADDDKRKEAGKFDDIEVHAANINRYYKSVRGDDSLNRRREVLTIRYEDLVLNTTAVVERLRAHTGLSMDKFDLAKPWYNASEDFKDPNDAFYSDNYLKPVSTTSLGSYKQNLSPAQVQFIETECRDLMQEYDYLESK